MPECIWRGAQLGVRIVPGIELDCRWRERDFLTLGIGIDITCPALLEIERTRNDSVQSFAAEQAIRTIHEAGGLAVLVPPNEMDEATESTQVTGTTQAQGTAAAGTEALLEELSETFRTNPDSILMKLDELGLSLEDLGDEDNLASLATAMNEGAANMGLPTIEDLDSAVSTLHEKLSANWSSYIEVEEA